MAREHWHAQYLYTDAEYERMRRKYAFNYKRLLPADRECSVLDVGCGGGYFLHFLKSMGFQRLSGVDADPDAVAICRKRVTDSAWAGDAVDYLRLHQGEFGLVVCNHLIEHYGRSESLMLTSALFAATAPGGRVIVSTPNAMTPWVGYHLFDDLTHDHLYTADSLAEALNISGFCDVEVHPEGPAPYDWATVARYLLWKCREAWLRFSFTVDVGVGRAKRCRIIVTQGLIGVGRRPVV